MNADYILCLSDQRRLADSNAEKKADNDPWNKAQLSLFQRLNPNQRTHLQNFLESIEGFY